MHLQRLCRADQVSDQCVEKMHGFPGLRLSYSRFADREFYSDWWNATSMDVFSRKWNKVRRRLEKLFYERQPN